MLTLSLSLSLSLSPPCENSCMTNTIYKGIVHIITMQVRCTKSLSTKQPTPAWVVAGAGATITNTELTQVYRFVHVCACV